MVLLNLMGLSGWWLGKRFFIITNCTLIDLTRSTVCAHREPSALANAITEESGDFRFLRAACLANIKGSVGLILAKVSNMRISIPLDLSSRPFIPLPRFIRSRRPMYNTLSSFPCLFSSVFCLIGTWWVLIWEFYGPINYDVFWFLPSLTRPPSWYYSVCDHY